MSMYVSTGKAAKICGVTSDTVLKWIKKSRISALRTAGGHYRIKEESLQPFISERARPEIDETADMGGKATFCWEFHSNGGEFKTGCRNCMVFKAKVERCYLLAGLGSKNGHAGIFCRERCDVCEYYEYVNKSTFNILIVTDKDNLKSSLSSEKRDRLFIKFSCCSADTAKVIQDYLTDFIVVDDSMDVSKSTDIIAYLAGNPQAHGAQIVVAIEKEKKNLQMRDGVCALINLPFSMPDLDKCLKILYDQLLGVKH